MRISHYYWVSWLLWVAPLFAQGNAEADATAEAKIDRYLAKVWKGQTQQISKLEEQLSDKQRELQSLPTPKQTTDKLVDKNQDKDHKDKYDKAAKVVAKLLSDEDRIKQQRERVEREIKNLQADLIKLHNVAKAAKVELDPRSLHPLDIGQLPAETNFLVTERVDDHSVLIAPVQKVVKYEADGFSATTHDILGERLCVQIRDVQRFVEHQVFYAGEQLFEVVDTETFTLHPQETKVTVKVIAPYDKSLLDKAISDRRWEWEQHYHRSRSTP